jgi:hypothetical protein
MSHGEAISAAASFVRIEQQLTQGDENDDADDRRKEHGREGKRLIPACYQRALSGRPYTMQ